MTSKKKTQSMMTLIFILFNNSNLINNDMQLDPDKNEKCSINEYD